MKSIPPISTTVISIIDTTNFVFWISSPSSDASISFVSCNLSILNSPSSVLFASSEVEGQLTSEFHLVAQLDFFLSNNNDVTRTLAHDSGYYCTLRVKKTRENPSWASPPWDFPSFFHPQGCNNIPYHSPKSA